MHPCGDDAHTAALLGVAAAMARHAESLPGTYVFVFQPAEKIGAGARAMLDGGLLDGLDVSAALSVHLARPAPLGLVAARGGVSFAGIDLLRIIATGPGDTRPATRCAATSCQLDAAWPSG
jgi:amidohydrolase